MRTITMGMGIGVLAGMVMATMAINSMYPDVPRRMVRDGRRAVRHTKRAVGHMMH